MAQERRQEKSIHDIRQEIAHSRDRLARDLSGIAYEFDFPLKFRKSFQRHTATWLSAAVLTGVVFTAKAASRKKKIEVKSGRNKGEETKKGLLEAGVATGALRLAATLLKPVVVSYVTKKFGSYAGRVR